MRVDVAPVFWIGVNALHKFGGLRGAAKRIILAEFSNILFRHRVEGKSGLQNRPGRDAVHP